METPDSDLLRHVWQAVKDLALSPGDLKRRLGSAMSEFIVALSEPDGWGTERELLQRANDLRDRYFSAGGAISDDETRTIAESLLRIAREVEFAVAVAMHTEDSK